MKIEFVKTRNQFETLKKDHAITWLVQQPEDAQAAEKWILSRTKFKTDEITGYITDGYRMNILCRCNVFYDDSAFLSFMLSDMEDPESILSDAGEVGGIPYDELIVEFDT